MICQHDRRRIITHEDVRRRTFERREHVEQTCVYDIGIVEPGIEQHLRKAVRVAHSVRRRCVAVRERIDREIFMPKYGFHARRVLGEKNDLVTARDETPD